MDTIDFGLFNSNDINISAITGLKQHWKNHVKFTYLNTPRPDNGLTLILCREAKYTFPDQHVMHAKQNSLVYIPEGSKYSVEFFVDEKNTPISTLLINFILTDQTKKRFTIGTRPTIIGLDSNGAFYNQFLAIIELCFTNNNLIIKSMMYKLFNQIIIKMSSRMDENIIANVLNYIDNNLNTLNSVTDLSKHFAMSETTLRRKFHDYTGISPVEYINLQKIEISKAMLNTTEVTMDMICEQLNFYDASYFYKLFKKYTGITPSQYRNNST